MLYSAKKTGLFAAESRTSRENNRTKTQRLLGSSDHTLWKHIHRRPSRHAPSSKRSSNHQ